MRLLMSRPSSFKGACTPLLPMKKCDAGALLISNLLYTCPHCSIYDNTTARVAAAAAAQPRHAPAGGGASGSGEAGASGDVGGVPDSSSSDDDSE